MDINKHSVGSPDISNSSSFFRDENSFKNPTQKFIPDGMDASNTYKFAIVFIVLFFIFMSFLGINIFYIITKFLVYSGEIIIKSSSLLGYTAGDAINSSADSIKDVSKSGIDILDGAVHSVGDLLKVSNQSNVEPNIMSSIDNAFNFAYLPFSVNPAFYNTPVPPPPAPPAVDATKPPATPSPPPPPPQSEQKKEPFVFGVNKRHSNFTEDDTQNPIQNGISQTKTNWSLATNAYETRL